MSYLESIPSLTGGVTEFDEQVRVFKFERNRLIKLNNLYQNSRKGKLASRIGAVMGFVGAVWLGKYGAENLHFDFQVHPYGYEHTYTLASNKLVAVLGGLSGTCVVLSEVLGAQEQDARVARDIGHFELCQEYVYDIAQQDITGDQQIQL